MSKFEKNLVEWFKNDVIQVRETLLYYSKSIDSFTLRFHNVTSFMYDLLLHCQREEIRVFQVVRVQFFVVLMCGLQRKKNISVFFSMESIFSPPPRKKYVCDPVTTIEYFDLFHCSTQGT